MELTPAGSVITSQDHPVRRFPMQIAQENGDEKLVQILLSLGAKPHVKLPRPRLGLGQIPGGSLQS
jgi:hypothetical protein